MPSYKPVIVIAGIGSGEGTGGAAARVFAKEGYSVAIIGRGGDTIKSFEKDLESSGVEVSSFIISSYDYASVQAVFQSIRTRYPSPQYSIRAALYNPSDRMRKPFLEITPEDVQTIVRVNFEGAFAFSHEIISDFKKNEIDAIGKRGFLIFTGSSTSISGNSTGSISSAGKFAMRALSQSLAKEFGKQNIHVAHAVVDGIIITPFSQPWRSSIRAGEEKNEDLWLTPEGVALSYLNLAKQERSAWTWELDLRPAHAQW